MLDDHHAFALAHQTSDIRVERNSRNARHGNRRAVGELPALGERDADQSVGDHRILEERFVEVAHAKEHQRIRVAVLHFNELAHRRSEERLIAEVGRFGGCVGH